MGGIAALQNRRYTQPQCALARFADGWRTVLASRESERPEPPSGVALRSLTLPARLGPMRLRTALEISRSSEERHIPDRPFLPVACRAAAWRFVPRNAPLR